MAEIRNSSFVPQAALSSYVAKGSYEPASAGPYPIASDENDCSEDLVPYGNNNQAVYEAAAAYLTSIIPDIRTEPLSNEGTTSVVMRDDTTAYKVRRRRSDDYREVEDEAVALTVLSAEGVAPPLHLLIDAARPWRVEQVRYHTPLPLFGGTVRIPRVESPGRLAVLATELKEIGPITELPAARVGAEFNRFASIALKHNLVYEDCDFHYDRKACSAVVVDVGFVHHVDVKDGGVGLIHGTLDLFIPDGARPSYGQVSAILQKTGGLDGLHPLLHEYRERNS